MYSLHWPCDVIVPGIDGRSNSTIKCVSEHSAWVAAKAAYDQVKSCSRGLKDARVRLGCLLVELRARTERGTWRYEQRRRGIHDRTAIRALNDVADLRGYNSDQRAAVGLRPCDDWTPNGATRVATRTPGRGVLADDAGPGTQEVAHNSTPRDQPHQARDAAADGGGHGGQLRMNGLYDAVERMRFGIEGCVRAVKAAGGDGGVLAELVTARDALERARAKLNRRAAAAA